MDKIQFTVNGLSYSLAGSEVTPMTSLNDYLRNYLQLFGTKAMCHEGGCGACVVSVARINARSSEKEVLAVNSCLVHILSCHQWDITTVEGLGNRRNGYHAVQQRLADFNGTQCGYCTPGMVMNMYSLHKTNSNLTMKEVENSFGSNICRCTGYRPILDAFKSFATDLDPALESKIQDLEDLHQLKCLKVCGGKQDCKESDWCIIENDEQVLREVSLPSGSWYKAYTVDDVYKVFTRIGKKSYRFVAGNTGQGIYPIEAQPMVFIDISSIASMKNCVPDENLIIGAGMTLTELMATCKAWSNNKREFKYLDELYKHLDLVAHIPVRNVGTIAGNLALKNMHNDFPSDVFLLLATVGAFVTLMNGKQVKSAVKMQDFLKSDLKNTMILDVRLPPMSATSLLKTFKIMPRAQNAHAIVNAGFLFKLDGKKVTSATIIFGNITPTFVAATETEKALVGEELFSDGILQKALASLKKEVVPVEAPPEPSADCRKMLALGLFYKAILSLSPTVNPRYKSGGFILQREVSKGTQAFDTDKSLWPLNKPVKKIEALTQCSGEADYSCDVTLEPSAVQVAFVLSTICKGEIEDIDASAALKIPGVIAFYSAKDIPGKNSFTSKDVPWISDNEEILATAVEYYGQPIGVIAAVTRKLALSAVELVKVKYKKSGDKLILQVRDALDAPDKERRVRQECKTTPKERGKDVTKTIQGRYYMPSQYHYTMEPQSCTVINNSRGIVVRSSTQWMDLINAAVGDALGIDHNRVEVVVPRIGGGYGGKGARSSQIACACAVVAYKLNRTATLVLPIKDNMAAVGKRQECEMDYEVGINDAGLIQFLNVTYYSDCGCSFNDGAGNISWVFESLYDTSRWKIEGYSVLTDKASMTWCRAPGTTEAIAVTEHIMERIAFETKKDPVDIRLMHLKAENNAMKDLVTTFMRDCEFDARQEELKKFNEENAWKKKALKLSIMAYPILYSWNFPVTVSIHHSDGTISMAHGGIEMGQGINTKVAQVCAYTLKIPLEKITVRPSDSYTSPNSMASNGSITSDCIAFATVKACEELLRRLEAVKQDLENPMWLDVVKAAFNKGINLQASYMASPSDNLQNYTVYGVCAAEVELDVLTGNHQLRRVDLLEDTGISMSPDIDVGQIEGAFIMGLGLWTSEHLIYNEEGKLLTDRTWTYKPPGAKDIPADFRVSFRRNSPNPAGVLRSKATGEPAFTLAVVVTFALHDAIVEARKEFGYNDVEWLDLESPCNVEHILKSISPKTEFYKIN